MKKSRALMANYVLPENDTGTNFYINSDYRDVHNIRRLIPKKIAKSAAKKAKSTLIQDKSRMTNPEFFLKA